MADSKVLVYYRVTEIKCHSDDVEILEETPEGIKIRHTYRKSGTRTEFIPRDKIDSIVYEDVKKDSKKATVAKPKATAPKPEPKEEPVVEEEDAGVDGTVDADDDDLFSSEEFDDDDDFE